MSGIFIVVTSCIVILRVRTYDVVFLEYYHLNRFTDINSLSLDQVLISDVGRVKLADFGCSKQLAGLRTNSLDESLKALRGSVPWMAPEVIRQTGHSCEADMWSVGATVLEMVTAQHPWPEFKDTFSALFHIATSNSGPPVPDSVSVSLSDFFECCFKIIPKERSSAADLINHPFINTSKSFIYRFSSVFVFSVSLLLLWVLIIEYQEASVTI